MNCGRSYHDERGEVQDCTNINPCRSCLLQHIAQLKAQPSAEHPVCRICGQAAYELPSGVYLNRVNEFGVPGVWQCSTKCVKIKPSAAVVAPELKYVEPTPRPFPDPEAPYGEGYEPIRPEDAREGDEAWDRPGLFRKGPWQWMPYMDVPGIGVDNLIACAWRRKIRSAQSGEPTP